MFHYVYVLRSLKDKNFYIGYTCNLKRRFKEHCSGNNKSTKRRRPLELIFFEGFLDKKSALKREKYFKSTQGKRTLKLMLYR